MTIKKQNPIVLWGSIAGALLAIGAGLTFGYDTLAAPRVQAQIDTCLKAHQSKQDADMQELKQYMAKLAESQIEMGKAIARIEGKIERIK